MRAARFHRYGPAEVLVIDEVPEPHAGPDEIRIRASAGSVNAVDTMYRCGALRRHFSDENLPVIPGRDAAGTVDEVGENVTGVTLGDAVFGLPAIFGANAEQVVLTAWAPIPSVWSVGQAAAAGLAAVTAIGGLDALGDVRDRTLLIEGAAGGVGSATTAIAVARGARVIGTASAGKHEFLRTLGAEPTSYGTGLTERVSALAPEGVDFVIDVAGSGSLPELITLAGGRDHSIAPADLDGATALDVRYISARNDSAALREAAAHGAAGRYTPHLAEVFALEDIAAAHRYLERGRTLGKIIVTM